MLIRRQYIFRSRNIAVATCLAGIISSAAIFASIGRDDGVDWRIVAVLTVTVGAVMAGFPIAWAENLDARRLQGLLQGKDVLARWTIDAPLWAEFLALDERLSKEVGAYNNTLVKPRVFPAGGLEVIVGRNALLVGDDFLAFSPGHSRRVDILATTPACLDFVNVGGYDDEDHFRFPTARRTPSAAGLITNHFNVALRVGATERDPPA